MIPPARSFRPTRAEVDLGALRNNLRRFRSRLSGGARLLFVVKGDAYGHGAVEVCRAAEGLGLAYGFGVSSVEEGVILRDARISRPILILGSLYPFEGSFRAALEYGLTPTVASLEAARRLAESAQRLPRSKRIACHLKLDTGMGRIGMGWPSGLEAARYLGGLRSVRFEGVYTHLACAESDPAYTRLQMSRFRAALRGMAREGIAVRLAHAANSASALRFRSSHFDMVRPGLAIYGLYGEGFQPVLSLKSAVVFIKNVPAGTPISYCRTFRTRRRSRIATLAIGYADGVPRSLSNRAEALVRGRRVPVVGAITMDMMMVDVTGVCEARVGDEAVLIGRSGAGEIGAAELARLADTIPYELVTRISARVPRVYIS